MSKKKLWLADTDEDWLRQNYKNLRWADICKYKHLSETFIREMADQIDWFFVSEDQVFSIDFIREMRNKLSLRHLLSSVAVG